MIQGPHEDTSKSSVLLSGTGALGEASLEDGGGGGGFLCPGECALCKQPGVFVPGTKSHLMLRDNNKYLC